MDYRQESDYTEVINNLIETRPYRTLSHRYKMISQISEMYLMNKK